MSNDDGEEESDTMSDLLDPDENVTGDEFNESIVTAPLKQDKKVTNKSKVAIVKKRVLPKKTQNSKKQKK